MPFSTYPATLPDSVSAMAVAEEAVISPVCTQADALSVWAVPPHEESRTTEKANTDKNCFFIMMLSFDVFYDCNISAFFLKGFSTAFKQLFQMFKTTFPHVQMFADLFKTCCPTASLSIIIPIFAS